MKKTLTSLRKLLFSGCLSGFENADTVIRYAPIVDQILGSDLPAPSLLEVGSGTQGIAPYLPFRITGVDLAFDGEIHPNLDAVCQPGTRLPFGDKSFDFVVSVDMLEHVAPESRPEAVREMIRVARREVYLAVPCGAAAAGQDKVLNEKYFQSRGAYYSYLDEHVVNGLPELEEMHSLILAAAAASHRSVRVERGKNFNLRLRYLLMRLWVEERFYAPYLLLSLLLCLIKSSVSPGNCYRHIFKIELTEE